MNDPEFKDTQGSLRKESKNTPWKKKLTEVKGGIYIKQLKS